MWSFGTFCDEFTVTSRLFLKLDLDPSRETLLHFFEVIRRAYPQLTRFRRRDDGSVVLGEDDDSPAGGEMRRYVRLDGNALRLGHASPGSAEDVLHFGKIVFMQAPYDLSLSDLDYEYMEVAFCFDLEYRGNHDELVADALMEHNPLLAAMGNAGKHIIDCQPFIGIALSEDCATQAYVELKSRTSTFEVRNNEFDSSPLSVVLSVRRYWGLSTASDLVAVHEDLVNSCAKLAAERVVPHVVAPLAAAIASRR